MREPIPPCRQRLVRRPIAIGPLARPPNRHQRQLPDHGRKPRLHIGIRPITFAGSREPVRQKDERASAEAGARFVVVMAITRN